MRARYRGYLLGAVMVATGGGALAAPDVPTSALYGTWSQESPPRHYQLRPAPEGNAHDGAHGDRAVLVIPDDFTFPGSHEFTLTRHGDRLEFSGADRPSVTLTLSSAKTATLLIKGSGTNGGKGVWMVYEEESLAHE